MEASLKYKIWGIGLAIVIAVYCLIPTIFHLPQRRAQLQDQEMPIPLYFNFFPQKGLNLGLDLRGGIYIEMEILVQEGVEAKLDLLVQDIQRILDRKQVKPESAVQNKEQTQLQFVFTKKEDLELAQSLIAKDYGDILKFSQTLGDPKPTLLFRVDPEYLSQIKKDIVAQAVQAVRNRIDRYGLAEPTVQRQGESRIVVELPGVKDPDRALKIIQQAGKLEFKLVSNQLTPTQLGNQIAEARKENNLLAQYSADDVIRLNEVLSAKLPQGTEVAFELTREAGSGKITQAIPYLLDRTVYITGDMLKNTQVQIDPQSSQPYVSLTFNATGAKNFADLTTAHVKEYLAIMLDGNVMSAPVIREPIRGGQCRIDLGASANRQQTLQEAKDLTLVLQEGALPARLKEATKTVIGPTLGADSIQKSLKALIIGSVIVILFMMIYYRLSGILADVAMILNTVFIFALLAMFQATLTLPGMAGIALTAGMAVDANVLIFERIREELAAGQRPKEAVQAGYSNAIRAIIDSNLTTIIAGVILYQFGTGPIRGFAVTLMIGLVCNLFTAVTMTKVVYEYFIYEKRVETISV